MNGWQRLWVLVSALLLVSTIFIGVALQPSDHEINQEKRGRLIEFAVNNVPTLEGSKPWEVAKAYEEILPAEFVERFKMVYASKYPELIPQINSILIEVDRSFKARKVAIITKALVVWLGIVALLYALGFGIGWVYRGFRQEA